MINVGGTIALLEGKRFLGRIGDAGCVLDGGSLSIELGSITKTGVVSEELSLGGGVCVLCCSGQFGRRRGKILRTAVEVAWSMAPEPPALTDHLYCFLSAISIVLSAGEPSLAKGRGSTNHKDK